MSLIRRIKRLDGVWFPKINKNLKEIQLNLCEIIIKLKNNINRLLFVETIQTQ